MKILVHRAIDRGKADFGWLKANYSFSFANYYNPEKENFGALRVLNDDCIQASHGFGKHPHSNMEIVTIPLSGAIKHADSTGNEGVIKVGDIQIMSAGSGILHSEFNASESDEAALFQIWIFPKILNMPPRYDQLFFDERERVNSWQVVVSPKENSRALWINQDAYISLGNFDEDKSYQLFNSLNGVYLMLIEGEAEINGVRLSDRDCIGISDVSDFQITVLKPVKLLAIEVPMQIN